MRRARGNTMALYAAFILFVGVPLMALTWDGSRLRVARVKLRNAADAGCTAYANMVDVDAWQNGVRQFAPNALTAAQSAFIGTAPPGSSLSITPDITDGMPMQAHCTATTIVHPFIDLGLGNYSFTVDVDAKSDWAANPFPK